MENEVFNDPNIARSYLRLSMPLVFSLVITMIYNLADTYFVAATNNTELVAGVSLGAPVFTLLMALGNIFGQGGSSLISRRLGSGDTESVKKASSFCFYTAILTGIIIGVLMLAFRLPLLRILGADSETFIHASKYYICLALGAPLIVVSFIHTSLLRAEGMSKESMIGTVSGAVVNIILDPIFISVLGLGAAGAAIATVLGYLFSDIYCFFVVVKKSSYLSVNPANMKIPPEDIKQIVGIGVSAALNNIMQSVSMILTNQLLLSSGNDKIAAMGIAIKISLIALLVLTGFTFGGQPLFGYFYGAGDKKRLREVIGFCIKFLSVIAVILTAFVYVAAPFLMGVFIKDQQIIEEGTLMLRLQVITMICVGFILLITILFQSTGQTIKALILSISRQGVVFVIVMLIASAIGGYYGILATQAVSDVITVVMACAVFYKTFYKKILV